MADDILHYGVKGMRWGVRKERRVIKKVAKQNVKSFIKDLNESGKTARLPITKEQYNSFSTKPVKIGAANAEFKRVAASDNTTLKSIAYVSKTPEDHARYTAVLLPEGKFTDKKFDLTVKASNATVSPGQKERVDTFIKTLDKEIAVGNKVMLGREYMEKNFQLPWDNSKRGLDNREYGLEMYNTFAQTQVYKTPLHEAYFDSIKSKGYNALVDDADRGILSEFPIILFPKESGARVVEAKRISKEELTMARATITSVRP